MLLTPFVDLHWIGPWSLVGLPDAELPESSPQLRISPQGQLASDNRLAGHLLLTVAKPLPLRPATRPDRATTDQGPRTKDKKRMKFLTKRHTAVSMSSGGNERLEGNRRLVEWR